MIDEVSPSIFRLDDVVDGRTCSQYLLLGTEGAMLVDTGVLTTPERIVLPALAELGLSAEALRYILVTHADVDHCGGLGPLQRAAPHSVAICGSNDRVQVEDLEVMIDDRYREFRHDHDIDESPEFCTWVRDNGDFGRVHMCCRDATIQLSHDWTVEVMSTPGHSKGHLSVFDPRSRSLLIGDAVLGDHSPSLDGAGSFAPTYRHPSDYCDSIAKLRRIDAQVMLTSHHPTMRGWELPAFYDLSDRFCSLLDAAILDEVVHGGGATTRQLLTAVAPRVRKWPQEFDSTLTYALVGHLEELAGDGLIRGGAERPVRWYAI